MKYEQFYNGSTLKLPLGGYSRLACCHCGLTHFIVTNLDAANLEVMLTFFRDDVGTLELRKQRRLARGKERVRKAKKVS